MKRKLLSYTTLLFLAACYPTIDHRGFNPEQAQRLEDLKIGSSTKEQVIEALGSPSTTSFFPVEGTNWKAWYYVYRKTETTSFFDPKVVDQLVIKITLDDKDIVRDIVVQKGVQVEEIKISKEKTKSTNEESSIWKDIFGNFGRYSLEKKQ